MNKNNNEVIGKKAFKLAIQTFVVVESCFQAGCS